MDVEQSVSYAVNIEPLSLPDGAGLDYGDGDVRHFAVGDAVNVTGISNPTRHLARRDSLIAAKVNELIEQLNNREQLVSLPVVRTVLPATISHVVVNHRVPPGYEARVVSAAISTQPAGNGKLEIFHSDGYGNSSGTALVTTLSEFPSSVDAPVGTDYRTDGELGVVVTNQGSVPAEIVASVILAMRPIGITSTPLGAGLIAPKGNKGDPGPPGLNWRGHWLGGGTSYAKNDGVYSSTSGNSYICKVPTSSVNPDADAGVQVNGIGVNWDVLCKASAGAPINGINGLDGPSYKGDWSHLFGTYYDGTSSAGAAAIVSRLGSSYICKLTHVADAGKEPGTVGGSPYWGLLSSAGTSGVVADQVIYEGTWSGVGVYAKARMVRHTRAGEPTRVWISNSATIAGDEPGVSSKWDELFGPSPASGTVSDIPVTVVDGISAETGYTAGVSDAGYSGLSLPQPLVLQQKRIDLPNNMSMCSLVGSGKLIFTGTARFTLPTPANGALGAGKPWNSQNTTLTATVHGVSTVEGSGPATCKLVQVSSGVDVNGATYFDVNVLSTTAVKVQLSIVGTEVRTS